MLPHNDSLDLFRKEFAQYVINRDTKKPVSPIGNHETFVFQNIDKIEQAKEFFRDNHEHLEQVIIALSSVVKIRDLLFLAIDAIDNNKITHYYDFVLALARNITDNDIVNSNTQDLIRAYKLSEGNGFPDLYIQSMIDGKKRSR